MAIVFNPPTFSEVINLILPVAIEWEGDYWTIDRWRRSYLQQVTETRREKDALKTFNRFTASLLQGFRTKHKDFEPRIERMNRKFTSFDDINGESIFTLLKEEGYSFVTRGVQVVLDAKVIVEQPSFVWEDYFLQAEAEYETGHQDDAFLSISGVGLKVRDFALKQFSNRWCAIDRNVTRVLRETGLILHGYDQPSYGDDPTNKKNYVFMQQLLVRFAKESGWTPGSTRGFSPGEIDSMFWFFGHGICTARPICKDCPNSVICITPARSSYNRERQPRQQPGSYAP